MLKQEIRCFELFAGCGGLDETLDKNDPNWYIGTYWGDVLYFKQHLTTKSDND